jgi:hypothetical protein
MMPAFLLVLRIGAVVIPLPWFALWLLLAPFALLAWLAGGIGSTLSDRWQFRMLLLAPRGLGILMMLSGTVVDVRNPDRRIGLAWL